MPQVALFSLDQLLTVAEIAITVLFGVGAVVAFFVGLVRYERGQRWQKAEVILSLINSFESDERVQAGCLVLDWDERQIKIGTETLNYSNSQLVPALRIEEMDEAGQFSDDERLIRDLVSAFLDFMMKLASFRTADLLSIRDLAYFYYWFELLKRIGAYKRDERIQEAMEAFIDAYRFIGVQELLEEYDREPAALNLAGRTAEARTKPSARASAPGADAIPADA